jgi:hypothetical protein
MSKPRPRSDRVPRKRPEKRGEKDKPGIPASEQPSAEDLSESVAGEEDPGASLDELADVPAQAPGPAEDKGRDRR